MSIKSLKKKVVELRVEALEVIHKAGSGHSGAATSCMEMLVALYYGQLTNDVVMHYDPTNPGSLQQDYFILSKVNAGAALYAVLADVGFFDKSELEGFRHLKGRLHSFPNMKMNGVHSTIGEPGHGLSVALGLALSLQAEKNKNRTFVLMEDRELQIGQVWESVMAAAHYKLDRLVLLLECSGVQADGGIRRVMNVDPIAEKFESFGWKAHKVHDGHDLDLLLSVLERTKTAVRRPSVIISKTVIAKGIPFAEGKSCYYGVALSDPEMKEFLDYSERAWKRIW